MEDNQNMINSTNEKVRGYLQEIYPDFVEFADGSFTLQEGSATVSVIVRPWHEGDSAVEFTSQLVSGATMTPEVMRWLLQKNVALHFGALGLLFDDTVVFSQTLPGCDLSRQEFESTIRTVATIADHYDDEIVAMAGGHLGSQSADEVASELSQNP
jgi:adenylate cyclase